MQVFPTLLPLHLILAFFSLEICANLVCACYLAHYACFTCGNWREIIQLISLTLFQISSRSIERANERLTELVRSYSILHDKSLVDFKTHIKRGKRGARSHESLV